MLSLQRKWWCYKGGRAEEITNDIQLSTPIRNRNFELISSDHISIKSIKYSKPITLKNFLLDRIFILFPSCRKK